jgi:hypothetical protein
MKDTSEPYKAADDYKLKNERRLDQRMSRRNFVIRQ